MPTKVLKKTNCPNCAGMMFYRCLICICSVDTLWTFLYVQGTELIVPKDETVCPSEMVDVICSYPDVNEMVGGKPKYHSTRPTWIHNERDLYPDGTKYKIITVNATSEMLRINSAMMSLDEIINLRLGCYFTFTGSSKRNTSKYESIIPPVVNIKSKPNGNLTNTGGNPVLMITTPHCVESFEYRVSLAEVDGPFFWNISTNQTTVDLPPLKGSNYILEVFVYASYHGTDIKSDSFHLMIPNNYINGAHVPYYSFLLLLAILGNFLYSCI